MVSDRKRSGKDSTGLPVLFLTVTEEQGIGSRIPVSDMDRLPYKATRKHGTVCNAGTARYYKVITQYPLAYHDWSISRTVDRSVSQTGSPPDHTAVSYTYILNPSHVPDGNPAPDYPFR